VKIGFFKEAYVRAKRRRSLWNLLLIPVVAGAWLMTWLASILMVGQLIRLARPELQFILLPDTVGGILMAVGLLFAWLPLSMIVGNMLLAAIPPARRALDAEASPFSGTDLGSSNKGLLKAALFLTPVGIAIALVGAFVL